MTIKEVKNYEGLYCASSDGYIIRSNRRLTGQPDKNGYLKLTLCKNNVKQTLIVHRIVAQSFIPNPENKPQVNHINGIKTDNRIENLEWCTNSENQRHAHRTGLKIGVGAKGERSGNAKLNNIKVLEIREKYKTGKYSHRELASEYMVDHKVIGNAINKKTWGHI